MIARVPKYDPKAPIVVFDIGNSSLKIGTWQEEEVKTPLSIPLEDREAFIDAFRTHVQAMPSRRPAAVVFSSVVPEALKRVRAHVEEVLEQDALVIGEKIPFPLEVEADDPLSVGTDRICAAAAAYEKLKTGCVVVDFGTAVTVDLISDEGVLLGGAILPGLRMQLRALHEFTACLPEVEPAVPDLPYGRSTPQAMQTGVCRGMAGSVRGLVEGYATHLNRWPQVVATGGDLDLIAPHCDFLDVLVSHLVLRGVGIAYVKHLAQCGA